MTYKIRFAPAARFDIQDAVMWYDEHSEIAGSRFLSAVDKKIEEILAFPDRYPIKVNLFRETMVEKFPYLIVYEVDIQRELVTVARVFHAKRNPLEKYR